MFGGKQERMQNWLKEDLQEERDKEVWPPSSPDYSLLDYFVWGVSELQVNAKLHNRIEDLIQNMKALMGSLNRDTVAKAYQGFRSKIEAVVVADGHFIEYLDSQCVPLLIVFQFSKIG